MIKQVLRSLFRDIREVYYFCSSKPQGVGYIMMMHHVLPIGAKGWPIHEELNITPEALEKFVAEASKLFDIIPLTDVLERIKHPGKRKFMAFTLDDGFQSVYDNALPIFEKYKVPFTIFVSDGFVGKECDTYRTKDVLEKAMSWDQILALEKNPLVTIGGHTVTHQKLAHIPTDVMVKEIEDNITSLNQHLKKAITTFAYPYGDQNQEVIDNLSKAELGIDISVLATGDAVTTGHTNNYLLPRVNLDNKQVAKELLHCRNVYMGH